MIKLFFLWKFQSHVLSLLLTSFNCFFLVTAVVHRMQKVTTDDDDDALTAVNVMMKVMIMMNE